MLRVVLCVVLVARKKKCGGKRERVLCAEILEYRDDQQVLNMLKSTSKKDDMADSFLQGIYYVYN